MSLLQPLTIRLYTAIKTDFKFSSGVSIGLSSSIAISLVSIITLHSELVSNTLEISLKSFVILLIFLRALNYFLSKTTC